jgi:ribosomal-protein-alanine N-acetyltransferase
MDHRLPVLMGRTLMLREPTAADADALFTYSADPLVTRFLAFDSPRTVDETRQFIARCEDLRRRDQEFIFVIADRITDGPLGVTALRHVDQGTRTAQIGTWIRRQDWGRGVNREAKALLLDYAFGPIALHRIEARIALDNERSCRAFERLGGRREGVLRQSLPKAGVFHDQALYAILADEWQARGGGAAILESIVAVEQAPPSHG